MYEYNYGEGLQFIFDKYYNDMGKNTTFPLK